MNLNYFRLFTFIIFSVAVLGCNTPLQSQKYFAQAVKNDPIMEPLHQTALYTVYFDHALQRCVLHSSYTWGESGGGTGGTGLGVSVFNCNPQALKAHADRLREQISSGTDYFDLPVPKVRRTNPASNEQGGGLQRRIQIPPPTQSPAQPQARPTQPAAPSSDATSKSSATPAQPAKPSAQPVSPSSKATQPKPSAPAQSSKQQPAQKPAQNSGSRLLQPITMP